MKNLGIMLIFSGIMLMGLSGLEVVLVFSSLGGNVDTMQILINVTPASIWYITVFTLGTGLICFLLGIGFYRKDFISQKQ